jgi:hypothetical protein
MTELESKRLDRFLSLLIKNVEFNVIQSTLINEFGISEKDVEFIVNYLREYGYVTGKYGGEVIITLKAKDLIDISFGGFYGQYLREVDRNIRLVNLENHQKVHRNQMILLTLILAVSGIVSCWYYLTELCKVYHWEYFFCGCDCLPIS